MNEFYKKILKNRATRRKILMVFDWVPDKIMLKIQYRLKLGRKLNLNNPLRYTEKLQWCKLYYKNPILAQCVDKYEVREYVKSKNLGGILNECYGVYNTAEDIDFDSLPDKFVAKHTLGGGGNDVVICEDKKKLDMQQLRQRFNDWLTRKTSKGGREWPYHAGGKPRIIIERLIEVPPNEEGGLKDYKFLCFNGKPQYIVYDTDRYTGHKRNIYDLDWNDLHIKTDCPCCEKEINPPLNLKEMIKTAAILSADFPAVRVDLYSVGERIYFGELTFFPWSGYVQFEPDKFDFTLGEAFVLPGNDISRREVKQHA